MDRFVIANAVFSKFSREYMELKRSLPIRPSELGVLNIITLRGGVFTPLMIAELLGVSKPMITAHVAVLEKNGYVYKDFALPDKRSFYVMPTEKARLLVEQTERETAEKLMKVENGLGAEKFSELVELLESARKILE